MDTYSENTEMQTNEIAEILEILNLASKATNSNSAIVVYGQIFNINNCDSIKLSEAKYEIITVIKKAKDNLATMSAKNSRNIELLDKVLTTFSSINTTDNENTVSNFRITCRELCNSLIYIEELYSEKFNKKKLSEKVIQELLTEIDELINDIKNADIESNFKNLFIQELQKLQLAMYKYKIYGNDGIENIISELMGKIILKTTDPEVITDQEKNIVRKILNFVANTNNIIKFSENATTIATNSAPLLLTMLNNIIK
ncbi:hypothetical protein [Anaeromicropila herbilytica]|uniref:Uncharacterized protein n=1 Tax=Anaeromicropila herbilytica TaxID=2785025 RepID=A0A7R7EN58_9FIRM|nr:hypothetical protein [Anaeromicropila herbilytica]BCN31681.1 hypothetical protein bsdtb5_29760 [Anaeromicropila herbilytica]